MSQIASSTLRSPVLDVQSPNPQVTAEGCKLFRDNLLDKLQECMFVRFQELWYQCECVLFHDNESGAKKYQNQDVTDVFKSLITGIEQWPDQYKTKEFDYIKVQVPKLGEWLLKIVLFQAHILATTQTSRTAKEIDVEKPDEKDFVEKMYKSLANEILVSLQTNHLYVFSTVQGNSIEAEKRKRLALPIIRRAIEKTIDTVAKIDKIIEEQMFENDEMEVDEPVAKPETPVETKPATPKPKTPAPKTPAPKTPKPQTPTPSSEQTSKSAPKTPKSTSGPQTPKSITPSDPKTPSSQKYGDESKFPRTKSVPSTPKSTPRSEHPSTPNSKASATPVSKVSATSTPVSKMSETPTSDFKKPSNTHRKNKHSATPMVTPSSSGKKRRSEPLSDDEVFVSSNQAKYMKSPPF